MPAAGAILLSIDWARPTRIARPGAQSCAPVRLGNLGIAYASLGRVEEAIEFMGQAADIFEEIHSPYAERARSAMARMREEKDSSE